MNDDQPIDIDQVGSDDSSMASGSSSGKKRAGAPAKYVWQYFKRYKDPLGRGQKKQSLSSSVPWLPNMPQEWHPLATMRMQQKWIYNKCWHGSNCQFVSLCSAR